MEYLLLKLSPVDATRLQVDVERSSVVGEGSATTSLPFDGNANKVITIFKILENKALEGSRYEPLNFMEDEPDWMLKNGLLDEEQNDFSYNFQEKIGQMLYSSLFPEKSKVRSLLEKAISDTEEDGKLLHLQIKAENDAGHLVPVFDYPWELLHDGEDYLAARGVAISRYIRYKAVPPDLPQVQQINVLLICSRAYDIDNKLFKLPEEGFKQVRESLEDVDQDGLISLNVLEKATFKELGKYLTEHRDEEVPHVIHFDGHGLIGRRCMLQSCKKVYPGVGQDTCSCGAKLDKPEGYLLFEDDDTHKANYISAKTLARKLLLANRSEKGNKQPGVVLIVLSACQSGLSFGADSVFNGVAQSLIRVKIPAVVGMQFSVSVDGAAKFTDKFYQSLNQCDSLLEALTRSREEMGFEDNQWYRPVLYFRSLDDEGGKIFTGQPGTQNGRKSQKASHDILDSAFQYDAEMLQKESELLTISNWFDPGNEVGRVRREYASEFLHTIREVIQQFDDVLHDIASSEQRDDLVQFRYSLITPLDASVERLDDLARLLPASLNSNANTMTRQKAISKALHELTENVREVHIHITLYEALLKYKPAKLKSLFLKLGVPYKDMLADSHEMKISNLIEYCERNNLYEELVQEVRVEYPVG